jgi:ubiquinone/menaquinone biosynthesis C-methylase UbiE
LPTDPRLALSFGRVAELYDRVRPDYSQQALDHAQEALGLGSDACVVDLAAGTGRLTEALARRFGRVVAVEPDNAMRSLNPAAEVLAGTAESIPLPSASTDAVFVGEAFHWFDAARAVPEIARVLRPGGGVVLLSNLWWDTEPPLPPAALDLLRGPYVASGRAGAVETWREAFDGSRFEPLRDETFASQLTVDAETLLAMYQTSSSIAALGDDERAALVAEVRPLLSGPYVLPIRVELTWTRLARER